MGGAGMLTLAVHEDTNANAALVRDGEIIAAVAEERLTRRKYQPGFPVRAVAEVLRIGGVSLDDVDAVAAGNRYHFLPRLLGSTPIEGEHDLFGPAHKAWLAFQSRLPTLRPLARAAELLGRIPLERRFGRDVHLVDHHAAHAWSAWMTSPFPNALALTVDNMGDGYSARVFRCGDGRCEPLWSSSASDSPGQFYGEISQFLGFHVLEAGKVTGLAARGDPAAAYPLMERIFSLDERRLEFRLAPTWARSRRWGPYRELARFSREDIAAAAQQRLEDVVCSWARLALQETGERNLVLAGGVFANVLLNHRLWCLPEVDGLFVHPAMSDQGIAVGAALAQQGAARPLRPQALTHAYLGPEYSEDEIGAALEVEGIAYERCSDVDAKVAQLIVEGRVIGRFSGRMEYGPRALGNRSILCRTGEAAVNDWLNARLERSEFMPFAPATLAGHAAACYQGYADGIAHAARFMTVTFPCSDAMRRASPAVVHVDGTARPQVVHEETSPGFHRILSHVHEKTGVPSVVNTSFNTHGEPIVCTPQDAARMISEGRIDVLAIGPFLADRERNQRRGSSRREAPSASTATRSGSPRSAKRAAR